MNRVLSLQHNQTIDIRGGETKGFYQSVKLWWKFFWWKFMSGGNFLKKTGSVLHFLRKLKFVYWIASSWGHLFSAFPSSLVQMRKSILRLTANTLPHFNSLQGSVLLIHINGDGDTMGRALITTTDMSPVRGIQTHLTVHAVSLYVPCLPLSWLVIITDGPSCEIFRARTVLLRLPHRALGQTDRPGDPSFNVIFHDSLYLDIPWNANTQIPILAPSIDIIQRENNLGWKQKSWGTLK